MFTAIFGVIMSVAIIGAIIWCVDQIEDYMTNENVCDEFTVFTA